jgi:tetratricopeptide (TPR) repeat protein
VRGRRLLPLVAAFALVALPARAGAQSEDARAALRSGDYDRAVRAFRARVHAEPASAEARRGLIEALAVTGRYDDAVAVAREAPDPGAVADALGRVLERRGDLDGAEAAYRSAVEAGGEDRLTAEVDLADLLFRRGRVDEAMERFDRFIDVYNQADGKLSARDLVAVGRAVHRLGRTDPDLHEDALRAFDEAAAADPGWAEPSVRAGTLFLEKYASPEAQAEFGEVLAANPKDPQALLGMARALEFDGTGGAGERIRAALEVNEHDPDAHTLRARLDIAREDFEAGAGSAERALEVDPASLEALSMLAAARFLADDTAGFQEARARALRLNPRYAELDATVAELAVQVRRYGEAVERAATGVALDSASWRAWGLLGMNQLRTGRIEQGRASLERAFGGDPYNPWFKNSLDLLDTFDRFETKETQHFRLFLAGSEAELLTPYVSAIAEEAYDSLSRRYGVEPPLPVRVELFPSHADFSVRTLGETGLGALGVSFGSVLVMDSPSARQRGEYNWASTLWHELAHAFHLAISESRVPRWFSEGLAVHEQRKGRLGWGHQVSIPFLQALRDGRLKKVSELNDGFMRPAYPEQVAFSYYEASLVFQLLEDRHGFDAIRTMLDGYREGRTTEELFDSVLGTTLERFDGEFDDYLRTRFAAPLRGLAEVGERPSPQAGVGAIADYVRAHPGDLVARMMLGALLVREERYDEAEPHLRHVLEAFPEYGGPDSPYGYLARIHRERGELERASAALGRLTALSESNYDALLARAEVEDSLGDAGASAEALRTAIQVYPYDVDLHRRLAVLYGDLGDRFGAVRERAAVVALDPPDRAEALYLLAVAQMDAGARDTARRTVLRALEIAPEYDDALELLLALRRPGTGGAP